MGIKLLNLGPLNLRRTGREIRTPINGFGDRYSAIELCPYNHKVPG